MFLGVVNFMRRMYEGKGISIDQAEKLYKDMVKDSLSTAGRIFNLFMDDYLKHFDHVAIEAICYASTSRYVPDYVSDASFEIYEQTTRWAKEQDRERYFRLRERMVAECGDLLGDYEAMEVVFNIVRFMQEELFHGRGLKCNKKNRGWKKKFLVWRMKKWYFYKIQKVIPIAKRVFMFLFNEYHTISRNPRVKEAYVSATTSLIHVSSGRK